MDISSSIRAQNSFRLSGSVNNINSNTKALHVDMQSIDTGEEAAYLADGFDGGADISFLGDVPDLRSILKTVKQDSTFLFPADKQSIESMASLSGKPLTASEVADVPAFLFLSSHPILLCKTVFSCLEENVCLHLQIHDFELMQHQHKEILVLY